MIKSRQISDKELLDRLNKGDETVLKLLYERYWEELFISAYNLLKNREVCEDILQEIFISIWKKRGKIQIKISLKSYLIQVLLIRYTIILEKIVV